MATSDRVKLTGVWRKEAKDGTKYMMGSLSATSNIMIYPNKYKKTEKEPDYIVSIGSKKVDIEQEVMQEFPEAPF